ncbi:hypothetical protein A1OO_05925 [Enterovibrio norvegicus FF-33]|uniref:ABM domain-containing protein n=1 Tax=Enterovibrio norvegicus FF-454 TaxID=1185651 RepID=A0A1E5C2T2_9GAMM|nr:antibiotic biosynthesis monooxygenase [Enterovibrio norvegicus]OEE59796.1 hypothetical protein A1OK_13170 [Enterovibrio norvegicus FF-454]OEE70303.1 hypothetical protein A1OO_05925 [Enterovibrio norvegicus FF-33]OEE86247.1 hypothetical protein A1OQ_17050 [Enterovibrio norvegicus FF-162]
MVQINNFIRALAFSTMVLAPTFASATVIEIATFQLKDNVSYEIFAPLDKAVEMQHVTKQPGFISRESAKGKNGDWLVVVHWESEEDAQASMNSFMSAPAAAGFMEAIDTSTMSMQHYVK